MSLRVLRVWHGGVVTSWRERERELRHAGVDVTLVCARRWPEGGRPVTLQSGEDDFVVPAKALGRHPILFVYDPRPLWRLMRRQSFDIVDLHEEPYSLAATEIRLLRRWLAPRSRLILYSAQNIDKRYLWPFRRFERRALAEADAIHVCSADAADVLRGKGFSGEIRTLPLGLDVDRFSPGIRTQSEGLRLGYVGRLVPQKGVELVLEALVDRPDWSLEIVGDGPEWGRLEAKAAELGLGERVRFQGHVKHEELPDTYRALDALVIPSLPTRSWREQFCRVATEAMACGVPVVASDTGALPEVIGDGGLLFPPGDGFRLREALSTLAADPFLRERLGKQARRLAEEYAWREVAAQHHRLYEDVVR